MSVLDRLDQIASQPEDPRYFIVEKLGQGGMGQVFLAEKLGPTGKPLRTVVLKTVIPMTNDPAQARRLTELFLAEMEVSAGLEHRNVVRLTDWGDDLFGHTTFLEMERIRGISLVELMAARGEPLDEEQKWGPLPPLFVAWLGMQIFLGIQYAHNHRRTGEDDTEAGVVHRDLSPDNVMVDVDGEVKIIDWGIAKTVKANKEVSQTTMIAGKIKYMPPEQIQGKVEPRSDYYGAGVLLTAALSGGDVFVLDDLDFPAAAMKVYQGDRDSAHELAPNAPRELQDLLEELMHKDAPQRPASAGEVAERFKNIVIGTLGTDLHSAQTTFAQAVCEHHKEGKRTKRKMDSAPEGPSQSHRRPISKGTLPDRPDNVSGVAPTANLAPHATATAEPQPATPSPQTAPSSSRRPLLIAAIASLLLVLFALVAGVGGFLYGGFGSTEPPPPPQPNAETSTATQPPTLVADEPSAVAPPTPSPDPTPDDTEEPAQAASDAPETASEATAATAGPPRAAEPPQRRRGRRNTQTPRVRPLGGGTSTTRTSPRGLDEAVYGF